MWHSSHGLTLLKKKLSRNSIYTDRLIPLLWSFLRYYVHIWLFCKTYVHFVPYVNKQDHNMYRCNTAKYVHYVEQKKEEGVPRTKTFGTRNKWVTYFLAQEVTFKWPPQEGFFSASPKVSKKHNKMGAINGWHYWIALMDAINGCH